MLNKVFLIGRLTRDPEIRFLPSGTQITSFSIAVNRPYKVGDQWKEETYFFDIESFGYLAERLGKQLSKGTQILIEGSLRQDRWETSAGEKRNKVKIVADKVNLLNTSSAGSSQENKTEEPADLPEDIEEISSDEDVPF
ncbi:MAG: single-stranded DNA-binding protein [Aquificota bacterium]|nr:MAG: single-stranded DNA-binding protein [Aquificota bacterium]